MIRGAIARHASAGSAIDANHRVPTAPALSQRDHRQGADRRSFDARDHGSHAIFGVASTGDGECIIEPSVRCDHCGYCKSLGH